MERATVNIQGANLRQLKPTRHAFATKDAYGSAHNNLNHGQQGGKEDHPNFLPNPNIQSYDQLVRASNGSYGTCPSSQTRDGLYQEGPEGSRMDHDGTDEGFTAY